MRLNSQNVKIDKKIKSEVGMACQDWFLTIGFSAIDVKNGATKMRDMGGRKDPYMCNLCVSH